MSQEPDTLNRQESNKSIIVDRRLEWPCDLSANQWMVEVVDRHRLLAGINISGREPIRAVKTAFEMNQHGSLPRFEDISRGEVSTSAVYTEQCSKYVHSGFSEVTATAAYSFVSASVKRSREERTEMQKERKTLHTMGQYQFSMVRLTLFKGTEPFEIKPTQQFLNDLDRELNRPTPGEKYAGLVEVLNQYGHVFPTQVTLGGQLLIDYQETTQSEQQDQEIKVTVEAAVNLKLGKFEGSSGFEHGSSEQHQQKAREIASQSRFESVGGDPLAVEDSAQWVLSLRDHHLWKPFAFDTVVPIFELLDDNRKLAITQVFENMLLDPALRLTRFENTGEWSDHHATCELVVPPGYKIISGGAKVTFAGDSGNMLWASYPKTKAGRGNAPVAWQADSWDCRYSNRGQITIAVIALYDPEDEWDVKLFQEKSDFQRQVQAVRVDILPNYDLTGGGATVTDSTQLKKAGGYVNAFLVSSYPTLDGKAWIAESHDHLEKDLHHLEAFAIGIRPTHGQEFDVRYFSQETGPDAHPSATALPADENESLVLLGGGAQLHEKVDNHLIASYPGALSSAESWHAVNWHASSTDHVNPKPSKLTAYAIGVRGAVVEKPQS